MVPPYLFLLAPSLLGAIYHVSALHLGVRAEFRLSHSAKRDHISGLVNGRNLNYMVNITLGEQPLQVLIDTGSSDLWAKGPIAAAKDTGVQSGLTYALGAVSGAIKTTQLEFLGYTVPDQAFIEVSPSLDNPPVPGILGLGPNAGSRIHTSLNDQPQGNAVLDHIFQQNVSAPNILTVLLGRSNDPAEKYPGDITVGEILPGLENITSQPKHWQVLLDEEGIIGPDGKPIQVQTRVKTTQNQKQLTATLDTGYSFPQVPQEVSNAIYSGIPGASLQFVEGVNLAFKIGGQTYPVHPLDTNSDDALTNPDGKVCLGAVPHADFVSVRLNHTNASKPATHKGIGEALLAPRGHRVHERKNSDHYRLVHWYGLVLIGTIVLCCTRGRLTKSGQNSLTSTYRSYQRLGAPAPVGDIRQVRGYHDPPKYN
ncbi:aspartic peptidase domain-containing protein [Multifurca ochricompacta]|uniref:Aspartic peptidase domain-containing protein n=1 Tax=Multifurca ochricompacta TaxID=376703 RepID=A0AAD4QKQ7_9AGAM|nr:aspartic peptidase domain-containing protein [Multifurca ochricompacta]